MTRHLRTTNFAGLFSGFSIMTFIEWCEMLFFLIMGIPVFVTGGKLNLFACCVRTQHDALHGDDGGTTVCDCACLFDFPLISITCQLTHMVQSRKRGDYNQQGRVTFKSTAGSK